MNARLLFLGLVLLLPLASPASSPLTGKRPNIIFIITDDQGYGDISAHGNPILKTPNLDRLHHEGVRFTDFHVSPTCAPTRSALLTGRHEFRNGVTHTIYERERLTLQATTLPQVLQKAGYTTGIFGKWHLGDEPEYWPSKRGFDEMFIHGAGGIGQTFPGSCGDAPNNTYFDPAILHNGTFEKTKGYCTDVFFSQAMKWMETVKGTKPFYLHLATNAPHAPLQVRPEDEALYADKVKNADTAKYLGMVANIDDNVGRLLQKVSDLGLERDTLIIFMNDNGGTGGCEIFNAGMRGKKGTAWLGGTRASSFWRWPGTLQPASVGALTAHVDFFLTLSELAGASLDASVKAQVEGRSLVPLLHDPESAWEDRTLITHLGRWKQGQPPITGKFNPCSVRTTEWHLVNDSKKNAEDWQLFNVHSDPGEALNVIAQHPEIAAKMKADYERWWESVQPQLVNEMVPLAKENPFKELYWKQFGK
jgi:arylsulfatase A-like enzyme